MGAGQLVPVRGAVWAQGLRRQPFLGPPGARSAPSQDVCAGSSTHQPWWCQAQSRGFTGADVALPC